MKKSKTCLAFFICCILSLNMGNCNVKADNNVVLSNKAYLLKTGMPQKEIEKLDDDVMQFIVDDLKSGGKHFEYINSNIENQISILSSETLTGISFTASAFKNASTIYIYPTYEFTSNKQPRGKDSFSFQLGAAMRPYEYGGKLWYKDNTMNDWKVGGTLTANNQQLSGAEFSGSQLGTPDYAMKLKGVTYCHATAGNSSDKRIVMGYLYNPQKTGYSISFSYNGGGISYSPSGTAYTAYKTMNLSY